MQLLTVAPGSHYSTFDVYRGIARQLERRGVTCRDYDLDARLDDAGRWLFNLWRRAGKPDPRPSPSDVVYGASKDIIERALRWNVDGVLIFCGMFVHPDLLILLRRAHIRTAMVLSESPYDDDLQERVLPLVDLAWTNERSSLTRLRRANPNVNYLAHAYDPEIHTSVGPTKDMPAHDVVFVGSMFAERAELLQAVNWDGIDFGLYGEWRGLPARSKLRAHVVGEVIGNEVAVGLYRRCRIGLNLYRESMGWGREAPRITHAESMNPRTLELAACGTFQISQPRDEITEQFGDAIATFHTAEELGRLIRYYLQHPEERSDKARRAMEAIRGHTFAERAATILRDLASAGWPIPPSEIVRWPSTTEGVGVSMRPPQAPAQPSLSPV